MKKTAYLIVALLVLIAVYLYIEKSEPVVAVDRPLIEADSASITRLEIHSAKGDVDLIKQGDGWLVNGEKPYPANERTLGGALKKFSEMSKKAMISERPDKFASMEVDDSAGVRVTVHTGDKATTLILGKAGPTFQTSYARIDGSDEIWEVSGNHRGTYDRKLDDWRDKTINQYEMADITKLVFTYPDLNFAIEKQDTLWRVSGVASEFDADSKIVDRVTRMFSKMNTVEFADTLADEFFAAPDFQMLAELTSGETVDLKLKAMNDEKFFVRKAGAKSDFVVYKSTAEALMKKPDDFKPQAEEQKSK